MTSQRSDKIQVRRGREQRPWCVSSRLHSTQQFPSIPQAFLDPLRSCLILYRSISYAITLAYYCLRNHPWLDVRALATMLNIDIRTPFCHENHSRKNCGCAFHARSFYCDANVHTRSTWMHILSLHLPSYGHPREPTEPGESTLPEMIARRARM